MSRQACHCRRPRPDWWGHCIGCGRVVFVPRRSIGVGGRFVAFVRRLLRRPSPRCPCPRPVRGLGAFCLRCGNELEA